MAKFIYYLRNRQGGIERLDTVMAIAPDGLLADYRHEEQVTGFPESTVFWARDEGSSLGVAPLTAYPPSSP
jgi:hypothetical protein